MKDLIWTKPRFRPIFGERTQFSNLLEGLEGAEILRFQGPRENQIADHFRRFRVSQELHNKTLQVQNVYSIQFTALWYNQRVSTKKNDGLFPKWDNRVVESWHLLWTIYSLTVTLENHTSSTCFPRFVCSLTVAGTPLRPNLKERNPDIPCSFSIVNILIKYNSFCWGVKINWSHKEPGKQITVYLPDYSLVF